MPVDPAKRAKYLEWITDQGKTGGHALAAYSGNDSWLAEGPARIPFLSASLTHATKGGMAVGHMGRWYGPEGSGKSMTNWGLIYCAQNYPEIITNLFEYEIRYLQATRKSLTAGKVKRKMKEAVAQFPDGMSVVLFDTEQRAQLEIAKAMGVDLGPDKFLLVEENVIEEIVRQMREAVSAYHVVIVDSASNAESFAEANLEPGEYEQGTASQAWKRLRQVRRRLDRAQNTIIIVDQMRMQLGGGPRAPKRAMPPQNRFLKHNVSISIEFDNGKRLYLNDDLMLTDNKDNASKDFRALGTDAPEVAGLEMRCEVQKNSTGAPYRHGLMRFRFPVMDVRTGELVQEVGFDEQFEVLRIAEYLHIVEPGGSGMYYLLDENFKRMSKTRGKGDFGWRGEWRAAQALWEDEELRYRILGRLRVLT